jgi:signal peptidase I
MPDAPAKLILPRTRPETPREVVAPSFATRHRAWLRGLRMFLGLTVMLLLLFGFLSYDIYTVPGEAGGPAMFGIKRGDRLLLARYRFWREPRLGEIVFYRAPGGPDDSASHVGRIVGLPGEKVTRHGATMKVGGREPLVVGFGLGPDSLINDGDVIPEGEYFLLAESDQYDYADSRRLGYVPLENIQYRYAMNMSDTWSKK